METDGSVLAFTHPVIYYVYTKWSAPQWGHPIFGQPKCHRTPAYQESVNKMCEKGLKTQFRPWPGFFFSPCKRKRELSERATCLRCGSVYFRTFLKAVITVSGRNPRTGTVAHGMARKASRWMTYFLKEVFLGEKTKTAGKGNSITSIKAFTQLSVWSNPHTAPLYAYPKFLDI